MSFTELWASTDKPAKKRTVEPSAETDPELLEMIREGRVNLADAIGKPIVFDWLVYGLLPSEGAVMLTAPAKWGKSTFVSYIVALLARQRNTDCFGRECASGVRTLYIASESLARTVKRFQDFFEILELTPADASRIDVVDKYTYQEMNDYDLIVIDTLYAWCDGQTASSVLQPMLHALPKEKCVLILNHPIKGSEEIEVGGGALRNWLETNLLGKFEDGPNSRRFLFTVESRAHDAEDSFGLVEFVKAGSTLAPIIREDVEMIRQDLSAQERQWMKIVPALMRNGIDSYIGLWKQVSGNHRATRTGTTFKAFLDDNWEELTLKAQPPPETALVSELNALD